MKLKPLSEQVIVITGATSGIGLATAKGAAKAGAKVVAVARSEQDLAKVVQELTDAGGTVVSVVADVGDREQVRRVAEAAITQFGGFDTWVNNAGLGIFGKIEDVSEADARKLFDTNFWGIVNGSLIALETLKTRGGSLINLGSIVSETAIPLQGIYSASKHAIKGFTDALRVELQDEQAPVCVTLIKPSAINTPFNENAGNVTGREFVLPPPTYTPEDVAAGILESAVHGYREVTIGGAGRAMNILSKLAPRLFDKINKHFMIKPQFGPGPAPRDRTGSLYKPGRGGVQTHADNGPMMPVSLYTKAVLHPFITAAVVTTAAAGIAAAVLGPQRIKEWGEDLFD